ncbi:MAG: hypothetical protein POH28_09555, partial [Acidocella sp.]|nr:hypothetical protein [Acidocella sp.]
MKKAFHCLAWTLGFAVFGAGFVLICGLTLLPHNIVGHVFYVMAGFGAECGATVAVFAYCFGWLPGPQQNLTADETFGVVQGLWGMAGFGIVMVVAGLAMANILAVENLIFILQHSPVRVNFTGHTFFLAT